MNLDRVEGISFFLRTVKTEKTYEKYVTVLLDVISWAFSKNVEREEKINLILDKMPEIRGDHFLHENYEQKRISYTE